MHTLSYVCTKQIELYPVTCEIWMENYLCIWLPFPLFDYFLMSSLYKFVISLHLFLVPFSDNRNVLLTFLRFYFVDFSLTLKSQLSSLTSSHFSSFKYLFIFYIFTYLFIYLYIYIYLYILLYCYLFINPGLISLRQLN